MSKDDVAQPSDLLRPRHVGMPIKRTEDPRLLTGNGEYTADRKPDRPLHVAFRRSEQPHARIVRIDVAAAKAAPGVVAVFTAENIAGDFKPVIPFSRMANYYATPIVPLARDKVRYVGEAIVAVIADVPISRRGRARADRDRIRAARGGRRSRAGGLRRTRRCCTKRPAPTS